MDRHPRWLSLLYSSWHRRNRATPDERAVIFLLCSVAAVVYSFRTGQLVLPKQVLIYKRVVGSQSLKEQHLDHHRFHRLEQTG